MGRKGVGGKQNKVIAVVRTGTETRSSTKRPVAPEVSVHHTRPDEFQEQIQRVLEFVVHPGVLDRVVHGTSKGPVHVSIQEEPGVTEKQPSTR